MLQLFVGLTFALSTPQVESTATASGTWAGTFAFPGESEPSAFRAGWNVGEDDDVVGGFVSDSGNGLILGRYDRASGELRAQLLTPEGEGTLVVDTSVEPAAIAVTLGGATIEFTGTRTAEAMDADLDLLVAPDFDQPMQVFRDGLQEPMERGVVERIRAYIELSSVVGLSFALIVDGAVADVRSFGWQDYHREVKATHETMYRWASISKSVTGALASQMIVAGELDPAPRRARLCLRVPREGARRDGCGPALASSGHRALPARSDPDRRGLRRSRDPFQDRILSLDMFKESPLLFEPRTQYSYSTHGFALAGAAIERAGGRRFATLVDERIATPAGMESFQPDYQPVAIPERTRGYCRIPGGRVIDSGDSNVAWKLAGGGFISTVGDLARFGAALIGDDLLDHRGQGADVHRADDARRTGDRLRVGDRPQRAARAADLDAQRRPAQDRDDPDAVPGPRARRCADVQHGGLAPRAARRRSARAPDRRPVILSRSSTGPRTEPGAGQGRSTGRETEPSGSASVSSLPRGRPTPSPGIPASDEPSSKP